MNYANTKTEDSGHLGYDGAVSVGTGCDILKEASAFIWWGEAIHTVLNCSKNFWSLLHNNDEDLRFL